MEGRAEGSKEGLTDGATEGDLGEWNGREKGV